MSFSITWGLLVRMDGILSAEHFSVLYKQPQFYVVSKSSTGTTLKGHGWIHDMAVIYSLMSLVQSPGFTPTHALLDLLLELLSISWPCMPIKLAHVASTMYLLQ